MPKIRGLLEDSRARLIFDLALKWDHLTDLYQLIDKAIYDDPPFTLREGKLIKKGYDAGLDELRSISSEGKGFIAGIEQRERERTGISSLKVSYNRVFGYYIPSGARRWRQRSPGTRRQGWRHSSVPACRRGAGPRRS